MLADGSSANSPRLPQLLYCRSSMDAMTISKEQCSSSFLAPVRNSPSVGLRETDAQYLAQVAETDAVPAANKRRRSERSLGPKFPPSNPFGPLPLPTIGFEHIRCGICRETNKLVKCQCILLVFCFLCKTHRSMYVIAGRHPADLKNKIIVYNDRDTHAELATMRR